MCQRVLSDLFFFNVWGVCMRITSETWQVTILQSPHCGSALPAVTTREVRLLKVSSCTWVVHIPCSHDTNPA
jgi:hypothetical protein